MRRSLNTFFLPCASGAALALSFPAYHLYPLAWVALVPLFCRRRPADVASSAWRFFVAGLTFYLVLLQWLLANVYWAGGWAIWGYVALAAFMASYWAVFGGLWQWVANRLPRVPAWLAAAPLWVAMEWLQARLLTGFGWGCLAFSQGSDVPLLQWAALGGASAVSAVLIVFNALVAQTAVEPKRRVARAALAVLIALGAHGLGMMMLGGPTYGARLFHVGVLQSNFPLEMKWDTDYTEEMVRSAADKSRELAEQGEVDLLVWPESLIMASTTSPGVFNLVTDMTRETGAALLTGTMRTDRQSGRDRNSSAFVDAKGVLVDHYDKIHLAPFGEYVPLSSIFPFIGKVIPAIGDIEAGDTPKVFSCESRRFGPLICFEVLFGPMSERLRRMGADCLVVMTNLGWFGTSSAIPQELEIARVRAVETRLPLVHCANTGISGVFDPWGRFTCAGGTFGADGTFYRLGLDATAADGIMRRRAGVLPIALPGNRLIPHGPVFFPWIMAAISLILLAASVVYQPHAKTVPTAHL